MISYRPVPIAGDASNVPVPSTWPATPAGGFKSAEVATVQVTLLWKPWWAALSTVNYLGGVVSRSPDIAAIAYALHLELTNGWSFSFCLRYCKENLDESNGAVFAKAGVSLLTSRARAGVDEQVASAVTIALSITDGYRFLGDLGRYTKSARGMVSRYWSGNGPDHLMVQDGLASDGYVARFRFLEAKGNAVQFTTHVPRDFYTFKAQSLNAQMNFFCQEQPILSYVYLPVQPGSPLVAQWFNSPPRRSQATPDAMPEDRAAQALMLLQVARDQFERLLAKSRLHLPGRSTGSDAETTDWLPPRLDQGRWWFIARNGQDAIAIDDEADGFFQSVELLLDSIRPVEDIGSRSEELMAAVKKLQKISSRAHDLLGKRAETTIRFQKRAKFKLLASDACGILYLQRASSALEKQKSE